MRELARKALERTSAFRSFAEMGKGQWRQDLSKGFTGPLRYVQSWAPWFAQCNTKRHR